MLPRPKIRTPEGHKYQLNGLELLKLSAIYGANAAGKSNLVKALGLLQALALGKATGNKIFNARFKFDQSVPCRQVLAVEFWQAGKVYYYAVALTDGCIETEELYQSGLGKTADILIFERTKATDGSTQITFSQAFERDSKSQALKAILMEEFLDKTKTILHWLAHRNNPHLGEVKKVFNWFDETLHIISPNTKPASITYSLDHNNRLRTFADDMLSAYGLGITDIKVDKKPLEDFFGTDNELFLSEIRNKLSDTNQEKISLKQTDGNELVIEKENDDLVVKQLRIIQSDKVGNEATFDMDELSDGTIRLLDFLQMFQELVDAPNVYVVDELERSMHPSLAKELITKFSHDLDTKGQLIFTTHESNLLDQSIFRQDEIWFAEKSPSGSTDLYSLSDFKEHNTIDIRKGYLHGRYGAVPVLTDLHELNWHTYDTQ
jgi:uncharacterized protein